MLVITLGMHASGSTWLFNVVRALFAHNEVPAVTLMADDGVSLLDNIPLEDCAIVLKAHALDRRLLQIASFSNAKMIISTRDSRDVLVSQRDRFGHSAPHAATDLTKSLASIAVLPQGLARLNYRYEDGFTARPDTIREIAKFLGLRISLQQTIELCERLRPDAVKRDIAAWLRMQKGKDEQLHHPITHWHATHVGDGQIGKWRSRLPPEEAEAITSSVEPLRALERPAKHIHWPTSLFRFCDGRSPGAEEVLAGAGQEQVLVYGPYLHLPCGRWRAEPVLRGHAASPVRLKADVYLPHTGREVVVEKIVSVPSDNPDSLALEFDLWDHFQPVEVRFAAVAGEMGQVRFAGVTMRLLGPCDGPEQLCSSPVKLAPISAVAPVDALVTARTNARVSGLLRAARVLRGRT